MITQDNTTPLTADEWNALSEKEAKAFIRNLRHGRTAKQWEDVVKLLIPYTPATNTHTGSHDMWMGQYMIWHNGNILNSSV